MAIVKRWRLLKHYRRRNTTSNKMGLTATFLVIGVIVGFFIGSDRVADASYQPREDRVVQTANSGFSALTDNGFRYGSREPIFISDKLTVWCGNAVCTMKRPTEGVYPSSMWLIMLLGAALGALLGYLIWVYFALTYWEQELSEDIRDQRHLKIAA